MKINNTNQSKNKSNKTVIIILSIIALLLIAGTALAYVKQVGPFSTPTTDTSSNTESDGDVTETPTAPTDDKSDEPTTDHIPVNTESTATIDILNQKNGYINFSATATNVAVGGTCTVVYSNANAKPVTKTFTAVANGTGITCASPQVSEQEFSYLGDWTVTFRYILNDKQITTEKTITIQ